MSGRQGAPDAATRVAANRGTRLAAGCSLGVAAGFAACALLTPLAGVNYYFSSPSDTDPFLVAESAARLWLISVGAGALVGALIGALIGALPGAGRGWLCRLAVPALGVHLLALRGFWGNTAGAHSAAALPPASWMAPAALALVAAAVLWRLESRRAADAGGALLGLHVLCALVGMHLLVQAPYYASRAPAFAEGLATLARLLSGG